MAITQANLEEIIALPYGMENGAAPLYEELVRLEGSEVSAGHKEDNEDDRHNVRRAVLINRKFSQGLCVEENEELERLNARLAEMDAHFYAPIADSLREFQPQSESQLNARHSTLIKKKFRLGLSADEEKELERVNALLDDDEARFYEPIKQQLLEVQAQLRGASNASQPET